MITRGLKRDDIGEWVWLDDYVIKQEEVAVSMGPVKQPVTAMDPSSDQPVTRTNDEQHQVAPSVPSGNGRSSSLANGRAPSTLVTAPGVGQPIEGVTSAPQPALTLETSSLTASNVRVAISRSQSYVLTSFFSQEPQMALRGNARLTKSW